MNEQTTEPGQEARPLASQYENQEAGLAAARAAGWRGHERYLGGSIALYHPAEDGFLVVAHSGKIMRFS
jgi:hypothetical protein